MHQIIGVLIEVKHGYIRESKRCIMCADNMAKYMHRTIVFLTEVYMTYQIPASCCCILYAEL